MLVGGQVLEPRSLKMFLFVGFLFVVGVLGIEKRTDTGLMESCKDVSQYFNGANQSRNGIPATATNAEHANLKICGNGPEPFVCCTAETENVLRRMTLDMTYDVLHSVTLSLQSLMRDNSAYYQDEYEAIINRAENYTQTVLGDMYKLEQYHWRDCLHELFVDILMSLHGSHGVDLHDSVYRFYDNLFPIVFQNLLGDPSAGVIGTDYRDCLMAARADLNPRPFGDVPQRMGTNLARAVSYARTVVSSLATGADILHLTSQWPLTSACSRALTKLGPCAVCYRVIGAKPCRSFCTDVMDGCFSGINSIDNLWNKFVDELSLLHHNNQGFDLELVMLSLHVNISESILHSMETTHKYYQQILTRCGRPSSTSQPRDGLFTTSKYPVLHSELAAPQLNAQISMLLQSVTASRGFFGRLPDVLCADEKFLADDSNFCWNGSHLAVYKHSLAELSLIEASSLKQLTIQSITDKLNSALKLLSKMSTSSVKDVVSSAAIDDYEMLGDDPFEGSGGDISVHNDGGIDYDDDDDEDYDGSSGSGEDDLPDDPTQHRQPNKKQYSDFDFGEHSTRRTVPPYHTTWHPSPTSFFKGSSSTAFSWYVYVTHLLGLCGICWLC